MNDSTLVNGASKSTQTETASDTGITGDAASEAAKTIGSSAAGSTNSAKSAKSDTGKGRKAASPLPVSDLLNILQGILRDLQEAGLPVSAMQLPVSEGRPPRVAILMDHVIFYTGKFYTGKDGAAAMVNDGAVMLAPQSIEGHPNGPADTAIVVGKDA